MAEFRRGASRWLVPIAAALLLLPLLAFWRRAIWIETLADVVYGPFPEARLDIMRPRWGKRSPRPAVIVFHGGAWQRGDRQEMRERVCRRYLEQGFTVANVEYRHGIGFAAEDAIRATEWFYRHANSYGADPGRVVLTGESAGGHLALLAAFRAQARIAAVVNFYGIADVAAWSGEPSARATLPVIEPALAAELSPVTWIRSGLSPVLSIHGTADDTVPLSQSERLTEALQKAGGRDAAEVLKIKGAGHGFSPREQEIAYRVVFDFLRRRGVSRR